MGLLARVRGATPAEVALALKAAAALHCIRMLMRAVPYRRLLALVEGASRPAGGPPRTSAAAVARAMRRAARTAPGSTCLFRALAAYLLCRREQLPAELCIGVARENDGDMAAHAWVRCGTTIVVGAAEMDRYALLRAEPAG